MTDPSSVSPRGKRARWLPVLAIAPGAAAVFSTTMGWALTTKPETATPPPPAVPDTVAAAPAVFVNDAARAALVRQLAGRQHELTDLEHRYAALTAQLAAARAASPAAAVRANIRGRWTTLTTSSSRPTRHARSSYRSSTSGGSAPAAPPVYNPPPPPPPPPTHTTTGGSGARR